jgi:hypothetical protein
MAVEISISLEFIEKLRQEMAQGGDQPPCPFCRTPRVKRSDYIRCHPCATNWTTGERIDKDPRIERLKKFLTEAAATAPAKKKEEANT